MMRRFYLPAGFVLTLSWLVLNALGEEIPLYFDSNRIAVRVGVNDSLMLSKTGSFEDIMKSFSKAELTFQYSVPNVIWEWNNVSLVGPEDPELESKNHTSIDIVAIRVGRTVVTSELVVEPNVKLNYTGNSLIVQVSVYKAEWLSTLSDIVGWLYFLAWSISFYPQIFQNYKRQSVRGLSLDFVVLNLTGFSLYSIFNVALYAIPEIQVQYFASDPSGTNPVQINDVFFSLHATAACIFTLVQCFIYERGSQTISKRGRAILYCILVPLIVVLIVAICSAVSWLTFLETCSYMKLFVTLIKYFPQAYLNYTRKSTSGWSIGNVLLDFTGGIFSVAQMFIISYNHDDWKSIFEDFTKFGLGLFSIIFDIFFIIQHYVLYRHHVAYNPVEGATNPTHGNNDDVMVTSTSSHIPKSSGEADSKTSLGSNSQE